MAADLPFEKPLVELRMKIDELKRFTEEKGIDVSEEVAVLEAKAKALAETIYKDLKPWQRVQIARHQDRPKTLDYIRGMCEDFVELHGDRAYRDDPAVVGGVARFDGRPITVVGTQKGRDTKENLYRNFGMAHPEGYRKALRLMQQAEKFGRPVLSLIDTAGAFSGAAAEERGQAEAIARNLFVMAGLRVPVVCVITGEGGSGGALGLGLGDRILMLEHAWYSVIAPESAATLLWKDASLGQKAAEHMKITADDLLAFSIIDAVVREPLGGAQRDPDGTIGSLKAAVKSAFDELRSLPVERLLEERYRKYRRMGVFFEGSLDHPDCPGYAQAGPEVSAAGVLAAVPEPASASRGEAREPAPDDTDDVDREKGTRR